MFNLINLVLNIIILFRLFKYDKFYRITYNLNMVEDKNHKKNNKPC